MLGERIHPVGGYEVEWCDLVVSNAEVFGNAGVLEPSQNDLVKVDQIGLQRGHNN